MDHSENGKLTYPQNSREVYCIHNGHTAIPFAAESAFLDLIGSFLTLFTKTWVKQRLVLCYNKQQQFVFYLILKSENSKIGEASDIELR